MFINAIKNVAGYTRPINSIIRTYGGQSVITGSATLFFVNRFGDAVTCKHVAEMLVNAEQINKQYQLFKEKKLLIPADEKFQENLQHLEASFQYKPESIIQIKNNFVDCIDQMKEYQIIPHPTLDLAIIRFKGYNQLNYIGNAIFKKDSTSIQQGKFLCRLGFPFPEFNNFIYNQQADDISWTNTGQMHSPQFPIEGMVTRFLGENNLLYGIEMSTPGLRGQSGGPLFDENGLVCGMQFSTKHLHLGFDLVDKEIMINNHVQKISDYSFLHLGQCIHIDIIKTFLQENKVSFEESDHPVA